MRSIRLLTILLFNAANAQEQPGHTWSCFTNATRNIDLSHPRLNVGWMFEATKYKAGALVNMCYWNFYRGESTRGGSLELLYQRDIPGPYDLLLSASWGEIHYWPNKGTPDYELRKSLVDVNLAICYRYGLGTFGWSQPFIGLGWRYKRTEKLDGYGTSEVDLNKAAIALYRDHVGEGSTMTFRFGVLLGLQK